MKKNLIIDTDPGVDDISAITIALYSNKFDIKLITTTAGNVGLDKTTRNILHFLEKFGFNNIIVAKGADKPLVREIKDASIVHGEEGLGKYIPSIPNKQAINEFAVDKMYEVIKKNKHNITILELGPHTNLGLLFTKYPECEEWIDEIIFEGGSPYGKPGLKPHISFNISFDPEAADIVMKTKIKKTIIPSELGRYTAYFTYEDIEKIKNTNSVGAFLTKMYEGYVNRYNLDIVQTNDLCTTIYMLYPEIFKTYKCNIEVDTNLMPGKTIITEDENGLVTFVEDTNRELFVEKFMHHLKNINQ